MDVFSPLNCAEFEQLAALWVEVNLRVPCDKSSSLLDYNNWELKVRWHVEAVMKLEVSWIHV